MKKIMLMAGKMILAFVLAAMIGFVAEKISIYHFAFEAAMFCSYFLFANWFGIFDVNK